MDPTNPDPPPINQPSVSSGLRSLRPKTVPVPLPKPVAKRANPHSNGNAFQKANSSSLLNQPKIKVKSEEDEKSDLSIRTFRLRSGFGTSTFNENAQSMAIDDSSEEPKAFNVLRFAGPPTNTDIAKWTPPVKMHRFDPRAAEEDTGFYDFYRMRRSAYRAGATSALPNGPSEEQQQQLRERFQRKEKEREQFDASKVDARTAKRRLKAAKKLRTYRGSKAALDDSEALARGEIDEEEFEKKMERKKEESVARLPFVLEDSGVEGNGYVGEWEGGLKGDQYMLLAFSVTSRARSEQRRC